METNLYKIIKKYHVVISLMFITFFYVLSFSITNDKILIAKFVSIVSIVIYIYLFSFYFYSRKKIDTFIIYVFISFFFYFGQHFLILIGHMNSVTILTEKISNITFINTSFFIMYCLFFMTFIYCKYYNKINFKLKKEEFFSDKKIINLTIYIFFFISVIPCFYILYSNIIDNNNIGYAERVLSDINRTVGFNSYSILLLLSAFFIPSLLGLYVIKKWKIAIPITILYIIMYFKSGSRMLIFCLILTLIFIYLHFYMRKASTKKILAILCLLFLSIFSMVFVSKFRSNEKISHLKISELMELGVEQTFSQTGTIFASTAIVLEECPKNIDFSYGKTYISTFAYVLPNYLTKNYPEKNGYVDTTFAKSLSDYGNIGSSFIAECYYNFGYLSILLMPIFAILWIYLNKFITESHSNLFTTFGLYIFYYVTITIRSEGVQLLRYILWYFVPFFVIYFLLKKMKGLRNKKCQNIV